MAGSTFQRAHTPCRVRALLPTADRNGRPQHSSGHRNTRLAIIYLRSKTEISSVRTDSSASRGAAEETTSDARFLFRPHERINKGDLVEISVGGVEATIEIDMIRPMLDVDGVLHHLQVDGRHWASA